MKTRKFEIQEKQYSFPYHYLVEFKPYTNYKSLHWGCEYYSYMSESMKLISQLKFDNLLDVGCGDGKLINELGKAYPNKKFKGLDLSEPAIYLAKALNYHLKNISFENKNLKKEKNSYNVVVLNEMLEHVSDKIYNNFCQEVKKKLNYGGYLLVTVPTKITPVEKKHYRHYDLAMIKQSFEDLTILEHRYIFKKNLFSRILKGISHRRLIPKKIEKIVIDKFFKKASEANGRHLLVLLKKEKQKLLNPNLTKINETKNNET